MSTKYAAVAVLGFALLATSQTPAAKAVSAEDILEQLDNAILLDSFKKRSPAESLQTVQAIIRLNQMQIGYAKGSADLHTTGSPKSFDQEFYDLRKLVCKSGPLRVVDLDGGVHDCK